MNYDYIFKRAAIITWRFKILWIYGIVLVLCGQSNQGSPNFNVNLPMPNTPSVNPPQFPPYFPEPLGQTPIAVYIIAGIFLILLVGIIGIVVGAISRGALIKSVEKAETGEKISLSGSWKDGISRIVPLSLLQTLLYSPFLLLAAMGTILMFTILWPYYSEVFKYMGTPGTQETPPIVNQIFSLFPLFFATAVVFACLFFIIKIVIDLFLTFGSRAITLENIGVIRSFSRSWYLFRKNAGTTIILSILIFIGSIVLGLILAIPTMVIMMPIIMLTIPLSSYTSNASTTPISYLVVGGAMIIIFIVFSLINGITQVFIESLWTLAYREFVKKTGPNEGSTSIDPTDVGL